MFQADVEKTGIRKFPVFPQQQESRLFSYELIPAIESVNFPMYPLFIIPAQAGIPRLPMLRDARFRGHDRKGPFVDTNFREE
jgi:hypothetical protein